MAGHFTFVHAADLHLDAPFRRVDAADPRVRDACVEATFSAFDRIVDVCLERDAAFLIVAGDTYNTVDRSFRAQSRFRAAAQRLAEAGIHVFLAGGNHDPLSGGGVSLEMPENVHVFSASHVERVAFPTEDDVACVLYGRSYARARETSNLALQFKRAEGDPFAIGVLHANVGGNEQYEPYAPCSVDDLRVAHMDYWALGHIHQYEKLATEPPIFYPGSPQGLDPNETGGHGCIVVDVRSSGVFTEFVETAQVVWDRREVDLTTADTIDDVLAALSMACEEVREGAGGRPTLLRMSVVGRSAAHSSLASSAAFDELVEEVRGEQMAGSPWVWLDRVVNHTRPTIDLQQVRSGADFAADLMSIVDTLAEDELVALIEEALGPIINAARGVEISVQPAQVLERARDICLDRLLEEGGGYR
ncbi:MAG: DNA repair exonuclease [Coriobacteriia bacterium]|jgi:DNA repair exonuclease SbcCD nuclease subunit|nr:DNA repair exonuclease [Coriobacteriia bacterium]